MSSVVQANERSEDAQRLRERTGLCSLEREPREDCLSLGEVQVPTSSRSFVSMSPETRSDCLGSSGIDCFRYHHDPWRQRLAAGQWRK